MKIRIIFFLSLILLNVYLGISLYELYNYHNLDDISIKNGFLQKKRNNYKKY